MRINLAKVLPAIGWVLAIAFVIFLQSRPVADTSPYEVPPIFPDDSSGTTQTDRYLDEVAAELARPGLYVDPDVTGLDDDEVRDLDAAAADQAGPVRIAVLPAERLMRDGREGTPSTYGLAYDEQELVAQLYDRVGSDGTYAILVDASSESAGRSFTAAQYAEDGPTYDVEGAVDAAVDCCAPDYAGILETFVEEAGDEQVSALAWLIRIGGGLFAIVAGWFGWTQWKRRKAEKEDDRRVTEVLRAPLTEEVVELSSRVSSLPPPVPDTLVAHETVKVLDLVEAARQKLDAMETDEDAEAVATRLADARYSLTVIDAYRAGRPRPERTAPCFFDPRHGPSTAEHAFTPERGAERQVPVCDRCRADLDAARQPAVRTIRKDGRDLFYWDLGRPSRPYLNGYWQGRRHPEPRAEANRTLPVPGLERTPGEGFTFVWEPSKGGSGGGWGGGSGSGSRVRSFGGGRSGRSSFRSGGSRGF